MGKCLGHWAPPVFRNFSPEQVKNPEKLVDYLEKVCCHPSNSRETEITAMFWGLAHAYRALFNTIQYPQREEKVSGPDDKMTGTAPTPTSSTGTATTPTLTAGTAAEPGNQLMLVSVAPIHKKKSWKKKSAREHIVTWLLRCWDNRASTLEVEGKETKQLGSLSIDKAIGEGAQVLSLWR
ncbi:hypothetical protein QYF61_011818 [Mycteria americana]|uniref:Uncharacterized protein n=1 Tax=Mycteria americana TaxID=33587 RepID=A0AAN7SJK5_MYCAM|nr:hypothetical protein QYF61_011818 [Mycteria americana]